MKVGVIGVGFVGTAVKSYFNTDRVYDKYKNGGIGSFDHCVECDVLFLCLPTLFDSATRQYDITCIHETLIALLNRKYGGYILIKSTVEPTTSEMLSNIYSPLKIVHNPEFLSAKTSIEDFRDQKSIFLGYTSRLTADDKLGLYNFYASVFPNSTIIECTSDETESTKIFCNSFYSAKIQLFNEFYDICKKTSVDFEIVRRNMLQLGWINPMHTDVPGSDGQLSFGGACFPKDISAMVSFMKRHGALCAVLEAALDERNSLRRSSL